MHVDDGHKNACEVGSSKIVSRVWNERRGEKNKGSPAFKGDYQGDTQDMGQVYRGIGGIPWW